jgi:outer membrane protein OmpA-like peptidoglycan-associated protein
MVRRCLLALLLLCAPAWAVDDRDHDGVDDQSDVCPDEAEDKDGWEDLDGCPDPDIDDGGPLASRFVPFRRGQGFLAALARPALVKLADELRRDTHFKVIEVVGHRAASEPPELAATRAAVVKSYLVGRGVAPERLRVGQARAPGHAEVRFRVVEPVPAPGG